MGHAIFISTASKDFHAADQIRASLESAGLRCWIAPRDVRPGQDYGEAIIEAINDSRILLLVLSGHSNDSAPVMREVERAASKSLTIIPVRIEDVMPGKRLEYFISSPHWITAFPPPLRDHLHSLPEVIQKTLEELDASVDSSSGKGGRVGEGHRHAISKPQPPEPFSWLGTTRKRFVLLVAAAAVLAAVPLTRVLGTKQDPPEVNRAVIPSLQETSMADGQLVLVYGIDPLHADKQILRIVNSQLAGHLREALKERQIGSESFEAILQSRRQEWAYQGDRKRVAFTFKIDQSTLQR